MLRAHSLEGVTDMRISTAVLRRSEFAEQRWANGLGVTREIAVDRTPDAAHHAQNAAPFRWRLSMADLAAPGGPFSMLHGIDRSLTLLEGTGVTLAVDGAAPVALEINSPFAFPGDVKTDCNVGSATGRDLNAMWDRSRCTASVNVVTAPTAVDFPVESAVAFAVALADEASLAISGNDSGADCIPTLLAKEDAMRMDVDSVGKGAAGSATRSLQVLSGTVYVAFFCAE